jgi:hypothetical protein
MYEADAEFRANYEKMMTEKGFHKEWFEHWDKPEGGGTERKFWSGYVWRS